MKTQYFDSLKILIKLFISGFCFEKHRRILIIDLINPWKIMKS